MIVVRLVGRTHYQVEEPATLAIVVRSCTSPVHSDFRDQVARRLSETDLHINPAAARYAVDLAQRVGLLHHKLVWTNLGHVLALTCCSGSQQDYPSLTKTQKHFFLRLFLEFDGAAFLYFARRLETDGRVPRPGERWHEVAQDLFRETYSEYLTLATDLADRVKIRQLSDRRDAKPFRGKSGAHQCFVHLQTLARLGFVTRTNSHDRVYTKNAAGTARPTPTARLLASVPSIAALDDIVSKGALYDVAHNLLGGSGHHRGLTGSWFPETVQRIYGRVMKTGIALCPLQTLTEGIQLEYLSLGLSPPHLRDVLTRLRSMQRDAPRSIRFHVDVFGRPAFVKIS